MALELVRDVLDTQAIDRDGQAMGKVDGIVLELRVGAPPRVACVEIEVTEAWKRVSPRAARWAAAVARLWRRSEPPYRVPWSLVRSVDVDIRIDVDAECTPAFELEHWMRDKIIRRIPGSE